MSVVSSRDGRSMRDNYSVDLSAYHFKSYQKGLDPVDSFDITETTAPSTAVQLTQSYGSTPSDQSSPYYAPPNHATTVKLQTQQQPRPPAFRRSKSKRVIPAASQHVLSWRLDPDESLSDWTLTVVSNPDLEKQESQVKEEDESGAEDLMTSKEDERDEAPSPFRSLPSYPTKKYFVHRTQLAVGPRRSEYFAKLFKHNQRRRKHSSNGTRIELRPSAAAAFPALLDFVYSPVGTTPDASTETAVALRHLATCFGIRELFDSVTDFIRNDLTPETAPTYLLEAKSFRHAKLTAAAMKLCAQYFESIKFGRMVNLTPGLFQQVISSPSLSASSEVLSSRIASYCRCRPGIIDSAMLQSLTHPDRMPNIAPEESLFFLHLIAEVDDDNESIGGRRTGGKDSLYNRCVSSSTNLVRVAISSKHSDGIESRKVAENRPTRNAIKEYYSLPHEMKVDLLEHALDGCPTKEEVQALEIARQEVTRRHADENQEQWDQIQNQMEKMRRKYEKKLASYEARIEAQEQEIQAYAKELSKFQRVNNDYRVSGLAADYTYQQIPDFDDIGESVFGEVPPKALPRFGNQTVDGWVYHEERWLKNGKQTAYTWPVYYYKGK